MKYSLSPWVGGGREGLPEKEKKQERLEILQMTMIRQNRVPDRDCEAFMGAELMKMKCRSVWDHSRGPKPPKMTENPDFSRFPGFWGSKMPETKGQPPSKIPPPESLAINLESTKSECVSGPLSGRVFHLQAVVALGEGPNGG